MNVLKANSDGTITVVTTTIAQTQVDNKVGNWQNREAHTGFTANGRARYDAEQLKKLERETNRKPYEEEEEE